MNRTTLLISLGLTAIACKADPNSAVVVSATADETVPAIHQLQITLVNESLPGNIDHDVIQPSLFEVMVYLAFNVQRESDFNASVSFLKRLINSSHLSALTYISSMGSVMF